MIHKLLYVAMTGVLITLMSYQLFVSSFTHEILGIVMLALVAIHMGLNIRWWRNLGQHIRQRTVPTILTVLLVVGIVLAILSGLIISRHLIFAEPLIGLMSGARIVHHVAVYWVLILMGVHIGIHGNLLLHKFTITRPLVKARSIAKYAILALVIGYGAYAFWYESIYLYLTMQEEFTFFLASQPAWNFGLNYLSILLGAACLTALVPK